MKRDSLIIGRPGLVWLLEDDDKDQSDSIIGGAGDLSEQYLSMQERLKTRDSYAGSATGSVHRRHAVETGAITLERDFPRPPSAAEYHPAEDGPSFDERNVAEWAAGNPGVEELYEEREVIYIGRQTVGISLDMSGSMRGDEADAKAAVGTFASGVQRQGGTVVINSFPGPRLVTGPSERFEWRHLNSVSPSGGTPMLGGIEDCLDLMATARADQNVLLVVTDGQAKNKSAVADRVAGARRRGIAVVGIGFGGASERSLEATFGQDGFVQCDIDTLADVLVDAYYDEVAENVRGGIHG